jgi:hypothetical protein
VLGNWGVSTDRGYAPTRAEAMAVFKLAWEPMLGGVGLSGSQRSVVTVRISAIRCFPFVGRIEKS